jgi:alpha-amylase/alpha-mannosidase (GH57 family)
MHTIVVHQHLYQPPREDPWLEVVPTEPSAAPDHDWNTRIARECYARLAAVETHRRDERAAPRDPDARAGLTRIVNLYAWCSFDVGPTLCEWLDVHAPDVLAAMQRGDAASIRRWGHGNAMAAPFHHVILPLASPRERRTEIRWGIKDFRRRFGRAPEGFWFPECAVDEETLEAVAAEGIRFTILAPYQMEGAVGNGQPVRWSGASGRSLTIVPYDGALAGDVAFGGLLRSPHALAERLLSRERDGEASLRCTTLATDGETFGHHHRGGEMALAEALGMIVHRPGVRLQNAATLVASSPHPPDIRLVSPSSWSCAHGVERWRSNCGCRLDGNHPPAQQWRGPLRHALTVLAHQTDAIFSDEGARLFREDPWAVRDAFGDVVAGDREALAHFANTVVVDDATDAMRTRARELLEMQRASLRTFTSCAWFFDEVDRIEVRQVLRYAARALELSGQAARLTPEFMTALSHATSGHGDAITAADVFVREALPHRDPVLMVAAAAIALATAGQPTTPIACFDCDLASHDAQWAVSIRHRRTGAVAHYIGIAEGAGPSLHVRLGAAGSSERAWTTVPLHELPEVAARQLLVAHADDDHALLG